MKSESETLQNVWKNIKARAKADSAFVRRERIETGGGKLQEQTELVQSKCQATFLIATTINCLKEIEIPVQFFLRSFLHREDLDK